MAIQGFVEIIPKWAFHNPTLTNFDGDTVAMLAASKGPINRMNPHWYHDPCLVNVNSETVAIIACLKGYISILPDYWFHNPLITNAYG